MIRKLADIGNFYDTGKPVRRYWIGAAIGVASSLIGGLASSGANRRAMERQERQERANQAYYRRMANEKYLDTAAGRELVRQARELSDRQTQRLRGAQAVGGGTDAAVALSKEAGNRQVTNLMGQAAVRDQERKQSAMDKSLQSGTRHAAVMSGYDTARANNISKVASGLSDAAMKLDGVLGTSDKPEVQSDDIKNSVDSASGSEPKKMSVDPSETWDYEENRRTYDDNYYA